MAMKALVTRVNGEIVAETRNGVRHFHAHDAQGNTIALYDDAGAKTDTYTYWPYGAVRTRTGTTVNPYQYSGAWGCYKDSTGRTYMQARTLRHDITRWVSVDPLWPEEQAYLYVRSMPTLDVDPNGMQGTIGPPAPPPDPTDFIHSKCNCKKGVPKVRRSHPGFECYRAACIRACKLLNDYDDSYITENCPGWPNIVKCISYNAQTPPCTKEHPYWISCTTTYGTGPGGNLSNNPPHEQGVLNNTCCVECQIRACCKANKVRHGAMTFLINSWMDCEITYGKP